MPYQSVNPAARELLQSFIEHSDQQMIDALTDIAPENPAFKQEFFGTAALLFSVDDEEEAIVLANDSPVGLGGSVHTNRHRTWQAGSEPH